MQLTKLHQSVIDKIQTLLGHEVTATAIKRSVIAIELPDGERYNYSALQIKLEKICARYGLAKSVESCGAGRLALIL